jgi:hypothetical protein
MHGTEIDTEEQEIGSVNLLIDTLFMYVQELC